MHKTKILPGFSWEGFFVFLYQIEPESSVVYQNYICTAMNMCKVCDNPLRKISNNGKLLLTLHVREYRAKFVEKCNMLL
jgi:hypothetical protein